MDEDSHAHVDVYSDADHHLHTDRDAYTHHHSFTDDFSDADFLIPVSDRQ